MTSPADPGSTQWQQLRRVTSARQWPGGLQGDAEGPCSVATAPPTLSPHCREQRRTGTSPLTALRWGEPDAASERLEKRGAPPRRFCA